LFKEYALPAEISDDVKEVVGEETGDKKEPGICPTCNGDFLRRKPRVGFLQQKVFAALGYYPWHCSRCGGNFLIRMRALPARFRSREIEPLID
jgi:hypothetical protein